MNETTQSYFLSLFLEWFDSFQDIGNSRWNHWHHHQLKQILSLSYEGDYSSKHLQPVSSSFYYHVLSHQLLLIQGFLWSLYLQQHVYFEITFSYLRSITPLVKYPLASVGYLDACTIYCNYEIIIICPNTTLLRYWPQHSTCWFFYIYDHNLNDLVDFFLYPWLYLLFVYMVDGARYVYVSNY